MYVLSFTYWIVVALLALVHARAGTRLQRVLLLDASVLLYAALERWLVIHLAWVVIITWIGARSRHFTDDPAMLRFVRITTSVLAFAPLLLHRLGDDVVGVAAILGERASLDTSDWALSLLLPVGVAFYTLQAVDTIEPSQRAGTGTGSFVDHALHVAFFPTLLVGPVQRFDHLAPQLRQRRRVRLDDARVATLLITAGLLQKLVVADNLLPIVDRVFGSPATANAPEVAAALAAFGLGIVADLLGLSLLAMGTARLFGIDLTPQVDRPWLARSVVDFWDRFLSTVTDWFLRHVFLPLGGVGRGVVRSLVALTITFLAAAVWFGATAGMVVWALLHLGAVILQLWRGRRPRKRSLPVLFHRLAALGFVTYSWLWFRAGSIGDAIDLHRGLLRASVTSFGRGAVATTVVFGVALLVIDEVGRRMLRTPGEAGLLDRAPVRGTVLASAVIALVVLSTGDLYTSVLGLR